MILVSYQSWKIFFWWVLPETSRLTFRPFFLDKKKTKKVKTKKCCLTRKLSHPRFFVGPRAGVQIAFVVLQMLLRIVLIRSIQSRVLPARSLHTLCKRNNPVYSTEWLSTRCKCAPYGGDLSFNWYKHPPTWLSLPSLDIVTPQLDYGLRSIDIVTVQLDCAMCWVDLVIVQLDYPMRWVDVVIVQLDFALCSLDIVTRQLDCAICWVDLVTVQLDCAMGWVDLVTVQLDYGLDSLNIATLQLDCALRSVACGSDQGFTIFTKPPQSISFLLAGRPSAQRKHRQ